MQRAEFVIRRRFIGAVIEHAHRQPRVLGHQPRQLIIEQVDHHDGERGVLCRHPRDRAHHRQLRSGRRGQKPLSLFRGDCIELLPGHVGAAGGHELRAIENRAGIEATGFAEAPQERWHSFAARLVQQPAQRRALGQHPSIGERVFGHARDLGAGVRAGQLHADLLLAVGQPAQHVDGEIGDARRDQQHDGHVTGREPPTEAVAFHRRRYPERSTSVLMISVTTASIDSIEATAKAPTKLYSL